MRESVLLCVALLLCFSAASQDRRITPAVSNQFEVGRRTFWDFGPPFHFYDVFLVRSDGEGAAVERIILTPPVDECLVRGKLEVASGKTSESPAALLDSMNPCAIPEKELRKPEKCKHCQNFSGADIALRVRCGTQVRVIPAHIFEDYWFNAATPPKRTSSILDLVKKLDNAVGPGVMEKPAFSFSDNSGTSPLPPASPELEAVGAGEFDALFPWDQDKLSYLYRAALYLPQPPTVQLVTVLPYPPQAVNLPDYPPLAKSERIEGQVTFVGDVDANGTLTNVKFVNGHHLLESAVREVIYSWKFPKEAYSRSVHGTVEFRLNCHDRRP
jgi:TonB family protein